MDLTTNELKLARDWIKDCDWADIKDDSDVDELSDNAVQIAVKKFYCGGIESFKKDCLYF